MLTEYERLNRVLSIYRDAMRRHIKEILDDDPPGSGYEGDWFERKVIDKLPEHRRDAARLDRSKADLGSADWQGESQLDIDDFLFAVKENPGFRRLSDQEFLTVMAEINEARNLWAHPPLTGFTRAQVDRIALKCADVLQQFDECAADEISRLAAEFDARDHADTLTQILEGVEVLRASHVSPEALTDAVSSAATADQAEQPSEALKALVRAWHSHAAGQTEEREAVMHELAAIRQDLTSERSERRRPLLDRSIEAWLGREAGTKLLAGLRRWF